MRVLIACECSGRVREAYRKLGHDAWSCDIQPAEDGSPYHYQCDVREALGMGWDLIIAHPVCTVMAGSGVRWCTTIPKMPKPGVLYGPDRVAAIAEAVTFARLFSGKAPRVAIENPVGLLSSRWRKPDQVVQPWWFGDPFFKATCFWLEGLKPLIPTNKLIPPKKGTPEHTKWSAIHLCPPGPDRQRERSRTFPGLAEAMTQWGEI
jgi:hypothetical protein